MKKFEAVEKVYNIWKRKRLQKQTCLNSIQSKKVWNQIRPKSEARSKAGKTKAASLKVWQDCMKAAGKKLGTSGIPKKGTLFYQESKQLMKEKMNGQLL